MSRIKNAIFNKRILLGLKREVKEDINMLKRIYGVFNYQDLAIKLKITESAIKGWVKRKSIPQKYMDIIEKHRINSINQIFENRDNQKSIDVSSKEYLLKQELKNLIDELDDKKAEVYYHLIKAEILKEKL